MELQVSPLELHQYMTFLHLCHTCSHQDSSNLVPGNTVTADKKETNNEQSLPRLRTVTNGVKTDLNLCKILNTNSAQPNVKCERACWKQMNLGQWLKGPTKVYTRQYTVHKTYLEWFDVGVLLHGKSPVVCEQL